MQGLNDADRRLMQRALAALEYHQMQTRPIQDTIDAIAELRARLVSIPPPATRTQTLPSENDVDPAPRALMMPPHAPGLVVPAQRSPARAAVVRESCSKSFTRIGDEDDGGIL